LARFPATEGLLLLFFQAGVTLEKRTKEKDGKCQKDNMPREGELLRDAVEKPGRLLEAYTASTTTARNALLASNNALDATAAGPTEHLSRLLEKKTAVRKGEKGITLCMPMPFQKEPRKA